MSFWNRFWSIVKKYIIAISSILLFPLTPFVLIGSFIRATFLSLSKVSIDFSNKSDGHANRIKDFFTFSRFPSVKHRRAERLRRRLFSIKDETFLNTKMHFIVMTATLALQVIAVFTTFRGAMVFFEGIHWSAPLLITFVLVLLHLVDVEDCGQD